MLTLVSLVSGLYDLLLGLGLILAADEIARQFGAPAPSPRVLADTNGIFLVGIGLGYLLMPLRDPARYRLYLWLAGPLLKGAGALVFLANYLFRGTPASFLLFTFTDGTLAIWTLLALARTRTAPSPATGPLPAPPARDLRG